ncbi:hypothetical protein [Desulfovibrio sp.]
MKYAPPIGQEAQGEEAHYVDGNPELGILGSPVPAAAIEQGQRELLHVIKQAGLTPSSEDLTQLFRAIGKLISDKVPIATNETVGLVKGGANIDIGEDGTISLTGIDPWSVFPKRVPIAVDGVTFGGSDGRRAIMPGESEPRENWVKCDGGSDGQGGSVPNLQGRFILGASEDHKAGSTGGSETHAHSLTGTVGDTTLSVEQIAGHTHASYGSRYGQNASSPGSQFASDSGDRSNGGTQYTKATGGSLPHTHDLTGESGEALSLPPYYALSFIMRCA